MRLLVGSLLALSMVFAGTAFSQTKTAETVVENGRTVTMDYVLTVDGKIADSSKEHGPMKFVVGQNKIIPGLEQKMIGMKVGEERAIVVDPKDGYGPVIPQAIKELPKQKLASGVEPQVGMYLETKDPQGNIFYGKLTEIKKDTLLVDFNHPMAGKTLNFTVKIVSIE